MEEPRYSRIAKILACDLTATIVPKAELYYLLKFLYERLTQLEDPLLLDDNEINIQED
jgi:hypothetical protein